MNRKRRESGNRSRFLSSSRSRLRVSRSKSRPEPYEWSGIPDVIGYIRGARVWRIAEKDGQLRLRSVVRSLIWEPGQELVADCSPFGPGGQGMSLMGQQLRAEKCVHPPQPTCRCGIWGIYDYSKCDHAKYWKPGHLAKDGVEGRLIGGAIEAHGRVIEGGIGFRAQYARPIVLTYQGGWGRKWRGMVDQLAATYDIPIADRMVTFDKPE